MTLPTEISTRETLDLLEGDEGFLVMDIRDETSFAAGHIPGAISNPANAFDLGKRLVPIIEQMRAWGNDFRPTLQQILQKKEE